MVKVDFSLVDETRDFATIPSGDYPCRVAEVRQGEARDGSPRWSLRLEVLEGTFAGRTAGWDSMTFSDRGLPRVKHVLSSLGLEVDGLEEVEPSQILDRHAHVAFREEEYEAADGTRTRSLRVPYRGWARIGEDVAAREPGGVRSPASGFGSAGSGSVDIRTVDLGGEGEQALSRGEPPRHPF